MDGLEFAATLAGHLLSWPVAFLLSVVLLRKPIAELVRRLETLEGFGGKLGFSDRLARTEEAVDTLEVESSDGGAQGGAESAGEREATPGFELSDLEKSAADNPSYAIVAAWQRVADAAVMLANMAQPDRPRGVTNPARALTELRRLEAIDPRIYGVLEEMRYLRNNVAHGKHNPTSGEALSYVVTANNLIAALEVAADAVHHELGGFPLEP